MASALVRSYWPTPPSPNSLPSVHSQNTLPSMLTSLLSNIDAESNPQIRLLSLHRLSLLACPLLPRLPRHHQVRLSHPRLPSPPTDAQSRNSMTNPASDSLAPPPSPYPATVDPSPVESTNSTSTDATDIELDADEDASPSASAALPKSPADIQLLSPASPDAMVSASPRSWASQASSAGQPSVRLDTDSGSLTAAGDEGPPSVIHAPTGFKSFVNSLPTHHEDGGLGEGDGDERRSPPLTRRRSTSSPSAKSENTVTSQGGKAETVSCFGFGRGLMLMRWV